jgi:hypothetical protein
MKNRRAAKPTHTLTTIHIIFPIPPIDASFVLFLTNIRITIAIVPIKARRARMNPIQYKALAAFLVQTSSATPHIVSANATTFNIMDVIAMHFGLMSSKQQRQVLLQ